MIITFQDDLVKVQGRYIQKFFEIFSCRNGWIYAESLTEKGKPRWKSISDRTWKFAKDKGLPKKLTDEVLLDLWHSTSKYVGVNFSKTTNYLMLDIDVNSPYHPHQRNNTLRDIKGSLEDLGLNSSFQIQSSHTEGIHIYFPLPQPVKTYGLAALIEDKLKADSFNVAGGVLEIFPNKKQWSSSDKPEDWSEYQRHRLPLQQGSVLLDEDYAPYSDTLEAFIQAWEHCASQQDIEILEAAIKANTKKNYQKTYQNPQQQPKSSKLKKIKEEHEALLKRGFTAIAQTNDILLNLGRRLRILENLGGIPLQKRLKELVTNLPGYKKYCQHKADINQRCKDIARYVEKKFKPSNRKEITAEPALPEPNPNNQEKQQEAIERIKSTLQALEIAQTTFKTKTELLKAVVKKAASSMATVVKYWKARLAKQYKHLIQESIKTENESQTVCNSSQDKTSSHFKTPQTNEQTVCNSRQDNASSDSNKQPLLRGGKEPLVKQSSETQSAQLSRQTRQKKENLKSLQKSDQRNLHQQTPELKLITLDSTEVSNSIEVTLNFPLEKTENSTIKPSIKVELSESQKQQLAELKKKLPPDQYEQFYQLQLKAIRKHQENLRIQAEMAETAKKEREKLINCFQERIFDAKKKLKKKTDEVKRRLSLDDPYPE